MFTTHRDSIPGSWALQFRIDPVRLYRVWPDYRPASQIVFIN
jgi:hypothetical protein